MKPPGVPQVKIGQKGHLDIIEAGLVACIEGVGAGVSCGQPLELNLCTSIFCKKLLHNQTIGGSGNTGDFIRNRGNLGPIRHTGLGNTSSHAHAGLGMGT